MTATSLSAQAARTELYDIIQRDISFEEKAALALEVGKEYLRADNGHFTRIDSETDHWEALISTDPPDGRFPPGLELDLNTTYCRRTINSDQSIALSDAPNQGWANDTAFEIHGLHCYHGTKLVVDGEPYGTVCFVAEDPRESFSDGETMFAELVAKLLERELERNQHEAALTRQTNLSIVLNRVLRHNLRNDLSVIRGFAQLMADELGENPYGERTLRKVDNLIELGEKARQLDRVVAADLDREPTDLTTLTSDIVDQISREYPNASITTTFDEDVILNVFPSLAQALEEVIANAAEHSGETPQITVSVSTVPNAVTIEVVDNGPGLSSQEVAVLSSGAETPLTHGSGLGLWLVHWIVSTHDGSVTADVSEAGTTMNITIPRNITADVHEHITELRRAQDQFEAVFEEANEAMVILNDDAHIIQANSEASELYGLDPHSLLGQPLARFLPDDFDFERGWRQFQAGAEERDTEMIVRADGEHRYVEYSATADVVPGQHLVISRDVTERTELDADLARKTRAMDSAPIGIILTDPSQEDNPITYANEKFADLTGYETDEVIGRNCRFLQGNDTDPDTVANIRDAINRQEPITTTIRNYRKDGTEFWNELTIAPVTDESGTLTNYVGFQRDVTDRIE